jgi:hypothetical protein
MISKIISWAVMLMFAVTSVSAFSLGQSNDAIIDFGVKPKNPVESFNDGSSKRDFVEPKPQAIINFDKKSGSSRSCITYGYTFVNNAVTPLCIERKQPNVAFRCPHWYAGGSFCS